MAQNIDPTRVFEAAKFLMDTSLYLSQGVNLDLTWMDTFETKTFPECNNVEVDLNLN